MKKREARRRLSYYLGVGVQISWVALIGTAITGAYAQSPPDGCTIPVPDFYGKGIVQNALDAMFLGACDRHDQCYRNCIAPLGVGFTDAKNFCDGTLFVEMTGWCAGATVLQAVTDAGLDPEQFLPGCEAAVLTVYGFEQGPLGGPHSRMISARHASSSTTLAATLAFPIASGPARIQR